MYIPKQSANQFIIPGGTTGRQYPDHPNMECSIVYIETNGAYPEKGWSVNDRCTETLYMIEGRFELEVDDEKYTLNPGDVFMIVPGKKYRSRGNGKALDIITPAWDKSQNHIVE